MKRLLAALDYIKKTNTLNEKILDSLIQDAVDSVVSGEVNPLDAFVTVHFLEKLTDSIKKNIYDQTLNHIETSGEKIAYNVPIMVRQKTSFDYMADETYRGYKRESDNIMAKLTARKSQLTKDIDEAKKNNLPAPLPVSSVAKEIVIDYKKSQ